MGEIAAVKTDDGAVRFALRLERVNSMALPEMCRGTYCVVSLVVAAQLQRPDLPVPADQVPDCSGHVLGCRRFQVVDTDRGAK